MLLRTQKVLSPEDVSILENLSSDWYEVLTLEIPSINVFSVVTKETIMY